MRLRLLALVPTVAVLAALNVMAARGSDRTVTTTSVEGSKSVAGDPVQQGRSLFDAKGCSSCHVAMRVGPSLTNLKDRAARTKQGYNAEQYVRESVLAPNAFKADGGSGGPSGGMPTLPVSAAELDALVAYLLTL